MHLKRVSMKGFKSFADRTELTFEPGVAVIVGPNGSGKSNIVDALIWVMSAAPPSGLRAESGQDVLFLGNSHRRAASYSEVEIVLDNTDGGIEIPYQEVSVKRRLDSEGESRYFINGNVVRRMDVQELLGDAGLGKDMHSIIGQGKVDRLLSAKPADRRAAIEEAAGLGKYKRRRHRAELKLRRVERDLARIRDIESELESRLRPLKRQARAAERYSTLIAERWTLQLLLHKDEVRRAAERVQGAESRVKETQGGVFEAEKSAVALRQDRSQLDKELSQVVERTEQAREIVQRLASVRERAAIRRAGFEDRAAAFRRRAVELKARAERATVDARAARDELDDADRKLREIATRVERFSAQRAKVEEEISRLEAAASDERDALRAVAEAEGRLNSLREQLEGVQARAAAAAEELERREQQVAQLQERAAQLGQRAASAQQREAELASGLQAADTQREHTQEAVATAREHSALAREGRVAAAERVKALSTRLAMLDERLARAERDGAGLAGYARVADVLDVEHGYERAVAAALADDADAVVVSSRQELVELVAGADGARVVAMVAASRPVTAREQGLAAGRPLAEVVRPAASASRQAVDAVMARLAGVRVVDTLAEAAATGASSGVAVTASGAGIDLGLQRAWSIGESAVADRYATANERDEAAHELAAAEHAVSTAEADLAAAQQKLEAADQAARAADEAAAKLRDELAVKRSELGTCRAQCDAAQAELTGLTTAIEQVQARQAQHRERGAQLESDRTAAEGALAQVRERLAEITAAVAKARGREEALREEQASCRAELAALASHRDALQRDVARLEQTVQREEAVRERSTRQVERAGELERTAIKAAAILQDALEKLVAPGELVEQAEAGQREFERIQKRRAELEEREQSVISAVSAARREHTTAEVALAQTQERHGNAERAVTETLRAYRKHVEDAREALERMRAEAAESESADEPGSADGEDAEADFDIALMDIDPGGVVELADEERAELEHKLERLVRRVDAMGPINPLAAREYDEQRVRFDEIVEQRTDLEASLREIRSLIRDLDETIAARFNETFAKVKEHFERAIAALFPGGSGKLRMVQLDEPEPRTVAGESDARDSDTDTEPGHGAGADADPDGQADGDLDDVPASARDKFASAGVEIDVRPAGKPAGRLGMLSGGEKSLAALAFLFSLFLARPSPFYVLDEVEAALDDANIVRFLNLLEQYRNDAQFIVITHQVRTMEAADILYGVTMQDHSGVSSVIARRPRGKRLLESHQPLKGSGIETTAADPAPTPQLDDGRVEDGELVDA